MSMPAFPTSDELSGVTHRAVAGRVAAGLRHRAPESSPRAPARDVRLIAELIRYAPRGQGPDVMGGKVVLQ
jgi:hypothetical protein